MGNVHDFKEKQPILFSLKSNQLTYRSQWFHKQCFPALRQFGPDPHLGSLLFVAVAACSLVKIS